MKMTLGFAHIIIGFFLMIIYVSLIVNRRRQAHMFPNAGKSQGRLTRIMDALIWPAIFLWGVHLVFNGKYLAAAYGIIGIMLIPAGWFIMADVLAGMILKLGENVQPGDHIRLAGDVTGQIVKTGLRSLHLKKDDAEIVMIPYSSVGRNTLTKSRALKTLAPYLFKISVARNQDPPLYRDRIREATLRSVWSAVNSDPHVQLLEETEDHLTFQVTAYPVSPEYGIRIESMLKKEFG